MFYTRVIKTTISAEENALDNKDVKEVIKNMTKCDSDDEYEKIKKNGFVMAVDILAENTKVQINDDSYNDLIENAVYTTDVLTKIRSIKFDSETEATLIIKMRGEA